MHVAQLHIVFGKIFHRYIWVNEVGNLKKMRKKCVMIW